MVLSWIIVALFTFLLTNCGGAAPPFEKTVSEAQNQANRAIQGAIELGNNFIKVVNEQAIEPYLSNNPVTPDHFEFGFRPFVIPIRIAVDAKGDINISSSSSIVTPIGVFDMAASKKIIGQEERKFLVIQIDGQVAIYKLPPLNSNEDFSVDFSDKYTRYRLLSFEKDPNGNITLSLSRE